MPFLDAWSRFYFFHITYHSLVFSLNCGIITLSFPCIMSVNIFLAFLHNGTVFYRLPTCQYSQHRRLRSLETFDTNQMLDMSYFTSCCWAVRKTECVWSLGSRANDCQHYANIIIVKIHLATSVFVDIAQRIFQLPFSVASHYYLENVSLICYRTQSIRSPVIKSASQKRQK